MFNIPLLTQIPINEEICAACDNGRLNDIFNQDVIKEAYSQLVKSIID